jgi:hypothetical protein
MSDTNWGQRWIAEAGSAQAPAAYAMPRRVLDGVAAETMRRPYWFLVRPADDPAPWWRELADLLTQRGKVVATVEASSAEGQGDLDLAGHAAECVVVYGDDRHVDLVPARGARIVVVGEHRPRRGTLAFASVAHLRDVLDGSTAYQAASTYHEV